MIVCSVKNIEASMLKITLTLLSISKLVIFINSNVQDYISCLFSTIQARLASFTLSIGYQLLSYLIVRLIKNSTKELFKIFKIFIQKWRYIQWFLKNHQLQKYLNLWLANWQKNISKNRCIILGIIIFEEKNVWKNESFNF